MSLMFTRSRLARAVRNCTWSKSEGSPAMVKVAETTSAILPAGGVGGGEGGGGLGGGEGGGGEGGGEGGGDGGGGEGGGEGNLAWYRPKVYQ